MFNAEDIARQVIRNCDISDARHAGLYSICGLALRLRDLCKWDTGTPPWEEKDPAEVLDWIGRREEHWEGLTEAEYIPITVNGGSYPPFQTREINDTLAPHGLYYGAGYGHSLKPTFFLAVIEDRRQINATPVYTLGRELARDLMTLPALLQDNQVLLRTEAARLYLWDQIQYVKRSGRRALGLALDACGISDHSPAGLRHHLNHILTAHQGAFIYHELGEIHDRVFDRDQWREIVGAFPHSPVELLARSIKDLLADTGRQGTLAHIAAEKNTASLGFYAAFFDGLGREIFPEFRAAYERFSATGNWQIIEDARRVGHHTAQNLAQVMMSIYAEGKLKNDLTMGGRGDRIPLVAEPLPRGNRGMTACDQFIPPPYLRHPFVQTVLCSSRLRTLGPNPMAGCARETIIDAGNGVRLQGFWSQRVPSTSKGLVILLPGWEGSAESTYILSTGRFLFNRGYDIFRLNYRDHGDTHHLNSGLFLGTLIDEVFAAVAEVAGQAGGHPVFLVGFSIGGSFAIRVARKCVEKPITELKYVVGINPPIDPMKGTRRIDELRFIKRYFLKKWKRSLRIKQSLFPHLYDFTAILKMDNCMEMTETLIRQHTDYRDAADYFSRYTLTRGYLDQVPLPVAVITAEDDPVVPIEDFYKTACNGNVSLIIHPYGGHCGFINGLRLGTWFQEWIESMFSRFTEADTPAISGD